MPDSILDSLRMPWPVAWTDLFASDGPIIVEIGFGNGLYLMELALLNPRSNVLGLEISNKALDRVLGKIQNAGLTNVRLVRARAFVFVWLVCPSSSINELHINFPDPWPKSSHVNRRLIDADFALLAASRLVPGGLVRIATDDQDYASSILGVFRRSPWFREGSVAPRLPDEPASLTKYELIAVRQGRECYFHRFWRNELAVDDVVSPIEESTMPHAIIATTLPLKEIGRRFQPATWQKGSCTIRFIDFFLSLKMDLAVVDTYIAEGRLEQRVLLMVKSKQEGRYIITLRETGFPRPTPATHMAIMRLAEQFTSMDPGGKIAHNNLSIE